MYDAITVVVQLTWVSHCQQPQHNHPKTKRITDPFDLIVLIATIQCRHLFWTEKDVGSVVIG